MTTSERHAVITHPVGPDGRVSLRTVRGSVRVRGIDGDEARVEARYSGRIPADSSGDPIDDGALRVERSGNELTVSVDEAEGGPRAGIGRLLSGGGRPSVDFDVQLPRTCGLRLSGVSADLDVRGLHGRQEIRTVSGDASLDDVSGRVTLQSVSGDVSVRGSDLRIEATTTSGDLSAVAGRFEQVSVKSVSGDVRIAGAFSPAEPHEIQSVSGDLELAPSNGVTVRMSSISGSIRTDVPHRRTETDRKRGVVIGDGAADVLFRTMSGDALISRGPALLPDTRSDAMDETTIHETTTHDTTSDATSPDDRAAAAERPTDQLSILRALERGEIGVDEATRLLEGASTDA